MAPRTPRRAAVVGAVLAALAAVLGGMLTGCATAATRAPVEDRSLAEPEDGALAEPAAVAPAPTAASASYTVRRNDTLYSIAWRHHLDYKALAAANGIEPPYTIYPGARLRLPAGATVPTAARPSATAARGPEPTPRTPAVAATTAPTQPKPTPARAPAKPTPAPAKPPPTVTPAAPAKVPTHTASERPTPRPRAQPVAPKAPPPAKPPAPSSAAIAGWQPPVAAKPVRGFGGTSKGLDYTLPAATKVRAAAPGEVVYAGPGLGGYRHLVIVKASERYLVAYGINVAPRLQEGETVAAGATVAEVGGGAAGKFHFEIRDRGKPVDPRRLVGGT